MNGLKLSALDTIAHNFDLYRYVKQIKNFEQQQHFLSNMHQNLISALGYVNMQLNIKFHSIPSVSF